MTHPSNKPTDPPKSPAPSPRELCLTIALRNVLSQTTAASTPANSPKPLTLGLIIEATGERAFGVLMAFICLPFIQPIPLPGVSIPFGIALMILGIQIAIRKHRPWLPRWMLAIKLPQKFSTRLITFIARIFQPLERIIRPRLLFMQNPLSMLFVGLALVCDGFLLVFLPAFPGSNLIPAWIALVKILGITEEDGIALLAGCILSFSVIVAVIFLITSGLNHLTIWWN